MKKKIILGLEVLGVLILLALLAVLLLRPWMDRWGASNAEISAALPGDEFVPSPLSTTNRAISIHATPEQIFPWLVQMGGDRGGLYSYTWLERLITCPLVNADRIHPEWQDLKVDDKVKMCPGEVGPMAFIVAAIAPDRALILGHQNPDGSWSDTWQFVVLPIDNGMTRLILRTRTTLVGGIWDVIHPGVFIMERGMLLGIKQRAETSVSLPVAVNMDNPAPLETTTVSPTSYLAPEMHREFNDLLSAQQIALFRILAPEVIPENLPLSKISVDDFADNHQEIRLVYGALDSVPNANDRLLTVKLSNSSEPVTPESVTHMFKTVALDMRETSVRGQTGYLYWTRSVAGGNSASLAWLDEGALDKLNITLCLSGDWPAPDEQNPHRLDTLLLQTAESLKEAPLWPTATPLPTGWQIVTHSDWGISFGLPPGWKPAGKDIYQGPDGTARLEAFVGPGAWVGQACEWEANTHPEVYGERFALVNLPAQENLIDFESDSCLIASTSGGSSAVVIANPTLDPKTRFLILRLDTPNALHIALSLKSTINIPPQPTLSGSSYNSTPGSIQPAENITPEVTHWNRLTIEEYPIISTSVDSPGWFEFTQRIPNEVLDKRKAIRENRPAGPRDSVEINDEQVKLSETSVETPLFGWNSQAQVSLEGQVVYQYQLLPYAGSSHVYRLGKDGDRWVLEVNGMLVVDGKVINQMMGYMGFKEVFDWSLLDGRPFYFYIKDGNTYLSYDGQTLPLIYTRVFHKACCEPVAFNVGSNDRMVWFYAVKNGIWYYVELGIY
jgi:hypothetical protein